MTTQRAPFTPARIDLTSTKGVLMDSKPIAKRLSGTTATRPTLTTTDAGTEYFDTTLGKPVWWSGTAWKLADGTTG